MTKISRRKLLQRALSWGAIAAAAPFAGTPVPALAIGPRQAFRVVRLKHRGGWQVHASADRVLAEEIGLRTSVSVDPQPLHLTPDAAELGRHGFAILAGDRDFSLTEMERLGLERWLELGGFLLIDNAGKGDGAARFDQSVRRELAELFPRRPLQRISPDHVAYRSFYRLDYPAGRAIAKPYVEGLKIGTRFAAALSHNDLLGAFAQDASGQFANTPTPGGENQREMAFRFAVNLAMYALCLHYKDDQVHLDYLLHRRKWKIDRPGRP